MSKSLIKFSTRALTCGGLFGAIRRRCVSEGIGTGSSTENACIHENNLHFTTFFVNYSVGYKSLDGGSGDRIGDEL